MLKDKILTLTGLILLTISIIVNFLDSLVSLIIFLIGSIIILAGIIGSEYKKEIKGFYGFLVIAGTLILMYEIVEPVNYLIIYTLLIPLIIGFIFVKN